ncbi:uncharacterized protein LOC121738443 [Aricia agestis]|uniref:uncharacterized protein LOC121738443 n=1 Tax=Aricia agestis TaxID=91739 RepID=UPI001C20C374|nr:uncharacterized protein LOC121738443 [Aricia agestis]
MGESVNDITNNSKILKRKYLRNKNRKRIYIFSKNKPGGKIKRILLVGSSQTRVNETVNNEYELENVLDIDLVPRAVVTTPQLQPIRTDTKNRSKLGVTTDDRRALSQCSLEVRGNSYHYYQSRYISHNNANFKTNCKVYRCQISTNQEACCCSCNSDAMFEVMKSLYDCYKKKNCDNCNCILCGRWPREKRGPPASHEIETASKKKLLEKKKLSQEAIEKGESMVLPKKEKAEVDKMSPETKDQVVKALSPKEASVSTERVKEKSPDLLRILETTPQDQKEKIIRDAVLKGAPIPEAKTTTEKKIIDKIQKDVGLPPKPKSSSEKARYEKALNKGLITPLQGKTALQKEKILRGQANLGLKLPEGRTSSEKALISKVQTEAKATKKIKQLEKETAKSIKESKGPSDECLCGLMTPTVDVSAQKIESAHKIIKDKELGRISLLQGKTKSQKEKVLKGLALQGSPLPEGKTSSEKEILDNIRATLGLPPAPKTPALRQKYKEATAAGVIIPLEGKTAKQKEKILREQAALGIPLPDGRTASEKSMVAKIKAIAPPLSDIPVSSKILKKAKDTGLLTPLKGKPREEKEKILTGLAMHGVPLPEARTASERKIVGKIHADLGLPPPPMSSEAKSKYQKAYTDGLIIPLEGKTVSQKEKILKNQANVGLDLPVGRTPSEKVLIEKVKEKVKEFAPIQKLKGKSPKEKEKILKGLAMNGILLPEAKSPSEKKLIDKVRDDLGLPPEPTSDSEKRAYKQSIATGDIAPLEGKSQMQKEKILRNVAKLGLKMPTGRTPSEQALVSKVLAAKSTMPLLKSPTVEMERKVKKSMLMARLEGKPPDHKEKILKELAIRGIPLPEARTASEQKLIDKVRKDVTYPPTKATIGLPEGQQVTSEISEVRLPSQVVRKAKAAGLMTPLKGKKKEQKENILKGLAMNGIPLPQAKTPSEQKIIDKVQKQLGLPPAPETPSEKKLYTKAIISGKIAPLEGKTASQKEDIVKNQLRMGLDVPVGRTPSEKAIIEKAIQSEIRVPSHILKKAKDGGLLTPLKGKQKKEKESILKGLAMNGIPLPEAKTSSENKIIEKVREDLGLPPEPATPTEKAKYKKAIISGRIAPLEGKNNSEKEEILKNIMKTGLKLPKGRTSSEKSLINKAKKSAPAKKPRTVSAEKLKKAIDSSMVVPLEGKTKEEKEKILTDLAMRNIPLPKAKTASDKKIIQKVQADLGLPPQPKTSFERQQYNKALAQGYIAPLEGKTDEQKEKLLRNQAAMGLTLPKGRTTSEKALITKIKTSAPKVPKSREKIDQLQKKSEKLMKEAKGPSDECICGIISPGVPLETSPKETKGEFQIRLPSQVFKKAKEAGLLTPLEGKNRQQKEKIFKGLAMNNIPLPEAKTPSENRIIQKVRTNLGLPPPPDIHTEREKYNKAIISGQIAPLEGKTSSEKENIIKNQIKMGLNVPNGRTPSEKALIDKVKKTTQSIPKSKSLMVPLEGKTNEEKENILKDLALRGIPLPKAKTASDKKIVKKVITDVGLPPPPKTSFEKEKYDKAFAQGYIAPLEGKTAEQKEKLLRNQAAMGLTLPKGRTSSEKALIAKIKKTAPRLPKSQEQLDKLKKVSAKGMKEAKGPSDECICSIVSSEISTEKISTEVDKTQSEVRVPPEVLKKAKDAGLLTPLKGKKKEQKEAILRGLAMNNIPLPEATSSSDYKILKKVQEDLGLPPAPESPSERQKYKKAIISGKIAPMEGKTTSQKEDILRNQIVMGLDLPKGRTSSEKSLIDKVKKDPRAALPSQILKKAKAAGLLTPLEGKKKEQKEKILKGLAMNNIPLPEAKTASENEIIEKVRKDLAIPPAPKSPADKDKYNKAIITGRIAPLEGKTRSQKEDIIKNQIEMGFHLPKGRTSSEKSLIEKVKKLPEISLLTTRTPSEKTIEKVTSQVRVPSEVMKKAKDAGLLTPLKGKKKKQKEAILKGLALNNIPLPEAKTPSENKIIMKVREDLGLPPVPKSIAEKDKYNKAIITGHIGPLEGKTRSQKEEILKNQINMGLSLPKGRTSSEKSLIAKIKKLSEVAPPTKEPKGALSEKSIIDRPTSEVHIPSKIMKKAKDAGLLTPLKGKKKKQKEAILKGLVMNGIPLPEAKTSSEKKLLDRIRLDIGLPPEPDSPEEKIKYKKAIVAGKIGPLEGKTPSQKEAIVRNQLKMGLVLPKGRTSSEKYLIDKVKVESEVRLPSKQLRKAKAAGLLTPLEGKSKEQKESIFKGLAMNNIPLPEAKSPSENKMLEKVRDEIGLPPAPTLPAEKEKYNKAITSGHIAPLEGKTASQKEKIIRNQLKLGLNVPKGRTASEKLLIDKVKKSSPKVSKTAVSPIKSLEGKTKEEKVKIIKDLAMREIPLPDARTGSEKKIIEKVQADIGLPPQPKTSLEKIQYDKAAAKGYITPLEGKSSEQKENILRKQAAMGIRLPKGRTSSEKALIARIKTSTPKTVKERGKIEKLQKVSAKKIKESKGPVDDCICDVVSTVFEKGTDDVMKPRSILSEQIKEAEAAGYFKPLEGKPNHEKEGILRNLAMQGIALPKAKNTSEKKIIDKVRYDLGLPSEPTSEKEKQRYDKALTKGYLVPLEGKSKSQKEKILRNQAGLGLNLPKGRTPSEVALIEKVKTSTKKASKISLISEIRKGMDAKYGITESIQEVTKTTTCDKECGCDLKKVKFKHSYVKIRITSPDMSSICPCPEECFPGVKGGVFTDNEGIKITVGRVSEISGFLQNNQLKNFKKISTMTLNTFVNDEKVERKITRSESYLMKFRKNEFKLCSFPPQIISNTSRKINESEDAFNSVLRNYSSTISTSLSSRFFEIDSSLSFVTPNSDSNKSLDVLHQCDRYFGDDVVDKDNKSESEINLERSSLDSLNTLSDIYKKSSAIFFNSEVLVENLSQYLYAMKSTRSDFQDYENFARENANFENVKENDLEDLLKQIIAKELTSRSSSFIVIVPTSSEEISDCYSRNNLGSSICIQVSKNCCYRDKPRRKGCAPIKKIEFKLSNEDVSLRPCSFVPGKHSTRVSEQSATQEKKKSRVISTDTTQDRPCCCDRNNVSQGRGKDYSPPSKPCVGKSTPSAMSCTQLMDVLKKTMSVACGPGELSEPVKQKCQRAIHCKPKVKQQRTDHPCGCCTSSIELSRYEVCVDVDSKKSAPRDTKPPLSAKKSIICQCPDEAVAMDCEKYLKQVQSDMTRRTSGFKVSVEPRMSFEDVLKYYAHQIQSDSDCDCSKRKSCECPATEKPFNGLKLHVEGKGSAAKRFLCFELLDCSTPYQNFKIDSNSMLVKIDHDT